MILPKKVTLTTFMKKLSCYEKQEEIWISYMIKKSLHSEDLYNRRKLIKSEIWWETRGEQKNNVKTPKVPFLW